MKFRLNWLVEYVEMLQGELEVWFKKTVVRKSSQRPAN